MTDFPNIISEAFLFNFLTVGKMLLLGKKEKGKKLIENRSRLPSRMRIISK